MAGPGVDTSSALEFQREIAARMSAAEMAAIAGDLRRKSAALRGLLDGGAAGLDRAGLRRVLRHVFAARRRADQILDRVGPGRLGSAIDALLAEGTPVAERFDAFDAAITAGAIAAAAPGAGPGAGRGVGPDLAGELLHFTSPGEHWLWTRWLWDPETETGALRLVVADDVDLAGSASPGEVYLSVGRATAFVEETGKAAGFTSAGPGLFGTDVFLAAVYGIYMLTVLRMRMTQEFTRLVPPLPDLVRRLLGVYHLEV